MQIRTEQIDGVTVMHVQGELTADLKSSLVDPVTDLIAKPRARVVLELAGVEYINSAGLGELVRLVAQSNVQEGRIILANLAPYVRGVLEMTKLDRFFEVCPTLEDALARLR